MLSKASQYGILAMMYLARQPRHRFYKVSEIARALGISASFLTKVFQRLTDAGLTRSYRGPTGGVQLKKHPRRITVLDIIVAVDGDRLFRECVLGLPGCGDDAPCPIHDQWSKERERLKNMFASLTLDELVRNPVRYRYTLLAE